MVSLTLVLIAGVSFGQSQNAPNSDQKAKPGAEAITVRPPFTEKEATGVLNHLLQALRADSEADFVAMFDARKMPRYPAFRDQIAEFFAKFESFDGRYHLLETAHEQDKGIILVDFTLDLTPSGDSPPRLQKQTQLRLVLALDGQAWKIIDLTPRGFFN